MARAGSIAAVAALAAGLWLLPSTAGGSRIDDPASLHPDARLLAGAADARAVLLRRADGVAAGAVGAGS